MKIRRCVAGFLASFVLIASMQSVARADLLVSNLSQPFRADTPIGNPEFWAAQSFFSGVDNVNLDSIFAIVGNGANSPAVVAQLRKSDINGEIDNTVGGLLTTFTGPSMSGGTSVRTFIPNSSINLMSSEKYWFILGSSNAGTFDWSYAEGPLTTGPGALSIYADSSDGGITWNHRTDTDPYFIQVNGSSVPEPSSWWLMGISAVSLTSLVRRRRRAA
jgi:PEP-CTERM motif